MSLPNLSTCTEWSITSSAGSRGLIFFASPPIRAMASRIAARSATAGTPVKSCSKTRAGMNAISARVCRRRLPFRQCLNVGGPHEAAVFLAQQIFEQHANGKRQLHHMSDAAPLERVQPENFVLSAAHFQRVTRA